MKIKHTKSINTKNNSINILNNIQLLYFIFLFSILNIVWLLYERDDNSIIIFASCCLVLYLVNKNMIFVLGLSLIIVNIYSLVKEKEGYENKEDKEETTEKKNIVSEDEVDETEGYAENDLTQDESIMKKINQLDPIVFNTIKKLNSMDIDKINKTINELTNKVKDP